MNCMNKSIAKGKALLLALVALTSMAAYAVENEGLQTLNQKGSIDKALASIAQSNMMHRWNGFLSGGLNLSGEKATQELEKIGKEAQVAVGIPEQWHVPIRQISGLEAAAKADLHQIVLSETCFDTDEVPYGVQRSNLFHEAVHIKYHDHASKLFPKLVGFLSYPILTKIMLDPQGTLQILYPLSIVAGVYLGRFLQDKYLDYIERRADTEGFYATQCYLCVSEKAEDIRQASDIANKIITHFEQNPVVNEQQVAGLRYAVDWNKRKKRYLSPDENEIIAADLKQDNKVCAFHADQSQQ